MSDTWRLILDGPVDAATNMARDRAVQLAREEGIVPPTLRLYRWTRPTVTLGRFQDADAVDGAYCARNGIDVVRRFTGGRGVLHDDELTYSIVASVEDGVPRGVAASYRHLCTALVASFERLGVEASITHHEGARTSTSACYLATSRADVSVGAAKLSGSAQVWAGSTVLQHGSFVVSRDVSREANVFRLSGEQARDLGGQAISLTEILGKRVGDEELSQAVIHGFSEALGIAFHQDGITGAEQELQDSLLTFTDPTRSHVRRA